MTKITAWSPSRLKVYDECPLKAKYKHIDKLPEPPSPALTNGTKVHKAAEDFITGARNDISRDLKLVEGLLQELREGYNQGEVFVETELCFDKNWVPIDWFSSAAWCRLKLDVIWFRNGVARVIDWKTGKFKPDGDFDDQLELYAVGVLTKRDDVKAATGELVFVDHGPEPVTRQAGSMTRFQLAASQKKWEARVQPMLSDVNFYPKPSAEGCKYCPFSEKKGGPCKDYHKSGRTF